VTDQQPQLGGIVIGQLLNHGLVELPVAEGPAQVQHTVEHLTIKGQPVAKGGQRALLVAGTFAGGAEQCALLFVETAVELAQVVEGDARLRQRLQGCPSSLVTEEAQGAETHALVGNRSQALLDRFDRIRKVGCR